MDWKKWFEENGNKNLDGNAMFMQPRLTSNEMFEAFKARLQAELVTPAELPEDWQ